MMAAMTGLPYKEASSASSQLLFNNNYSNNRGYLEMQQKIPVPSYVRAHPIRHHADHGVTNAGKRKSAVELLQESKAFYVKSETVLDRKQELKNSGHLQVSHLTAPGAPPRLLRKPCNSTTTSCSVIQPPSPQLPLSLTSPCCWTACHPQDRDEIMSPQRSLPPALPPKNPRLVPLLQRRTNSGPPNPTACEQLQTKLRRLLNTDSKENICFPDPDYPMPPVRQSKDVGCEDTSRYSIENLSTDCRDGDHMYGAPDVVPFKFGRSNSQCHASGRKSSGEPGDCHKSLPDLHTSSRRRSSLSPRTSTKSSTRQVTPIRHPTGNCQDCETSSDYSDQSFKRDGVFYRGSRHIRRCQGSGGGDASSVLSSGGRTQKSSGSSKLSHGATARDSGGSSGHCTHRSEPSPRIQDRWSHVRRDSGASTQHSTERIASRKNSCNGGVPSPVIIRHYSPDSSSSNSQRDQSQANPSRFSEVWKKGRGRVILRSKSDISDRYWRQDNNGRSNGPVTSRSPRSTTQLESFFDNIGMDRENYKNITDLDSTSSSPVFFDSVSSVDSALGFYSWSGNNQTTTSCQQWQNNNCSVGMGEADCNPRMNDPPSIVERNARIIKWLCQCRKMQFEYS